MMSNEPTPTLADDDGDLPASGQRAVGVGSWTLRLDQRQRELDAAAAALLGLPAQPCSLGESTWAQLVHPADLALSHRQYDKDVWRLASFRVRDGNGGWRWLEERVAEVNAPEASASGKGRPGTGDFLRGVWIDISAAKAEENSLRNSERRIRGALQVAGSGWWDWNLQRHAFHVSSSGLDLLGMQALDPSRGLDAWLDQVVVDDRMAVSLAITAHLNDNARKVEVSFRVRNSKKGERWIIAHGALVERAADGSPARMLGTFVDQTEQVLAERELRALLEKFELACQSAGIGLLRYEWAADRWEFDARSRDLFGIDARSPPRSLREFMRFLPTEDAIRFEVALVGGTMRRSEAIAFDFQALRSDGSTRDIQALARTHLDAKGEPLDLIGVVIDVTADREARRALEAHRSQLGEMVTEQTRAAIAARDFAQQASAIKSDFLANISHELRTPLHAIIGFSQLALDDADVIEPQTLLRHVGRINSSARQLLRLVDDLLDLSKLDSGNLALQAEACELRRLLQTVCDEVAPMAAARRIHLDLQASEGLSWPLDPARFAQVVRNLVMNAIKYSPDGGVVDVGAKVEYAVVEQVAVEAAADPSASAGAPVQLVMRVRDRGHGVPVEALGHIFERFRQAQNAARREGTGLGLAIARELVALHGGSIAVRNHPDGGAEFSVLLPAASAPVARPRHGN